MSELVFLLEERSMQELLQVIVPPLLPSHVTCRFIPHEGKKDLEKSIPRKLRAWKVPHVWFIVVRDKDADDCRKVKKRLAALCRQCNRGDTLVRIVCHHLESWFLGDLAAVERAFGIRGLARRQNQSKFRAPDDLANAADELQKIVPSYQKVGGAREIAPHLTLDANRSHSFQVFLDGVRRLVASLPTGDD